MRVRRKGCEHRESNETHAILVLGPGEKREKQASLGRRGGRELGRILG